MVMTKSILLLSIISVWLPYHHGLRSMSHRPSSYKISPSNLPKTCQTDSVKTLKSPTMLHSLPVSVLESGVAIAFVVAFHEMGHFLAARWQGMSITSYNIGYGPKLISFNDSLSTEYALRLIPLGGYVAFPANVERDEETGEITKQLDDPNLLQNRPPLQRLLVISAGIIANFLLTFLISLGVTSTSGLSRPVFDNGILVSSTPDQTSPGYLAGLRANDVIVSLEHEPIIANEKTNQDFVTFIRNRADQPIQLDVLRDGKALSVEVTPRKTGTAQKGSIGIGIASKVKYFNKLKASNPIDAVQYAYDETARITDTTYSGLKNFVSNGFTGGGDVGGPIAVVKAGAVIAESSPTALLGFMAALSVNLAVLNALPLPALDGGQFAFVLIELVSRGKKLPRDFQEQITAAAFVLLLLFSVSTLANDITHINDPIPGFPTAVDSASQQRK